MYVPRKEYPARWREGVALAQTVERLNRIIFPDRELAIAFIISGTGDGADSHTMCYMDSLPHIPRPQRKGLFLIHPKKAAEELNDLIRDGMTVAQARFWMAAHETRHRLQDLEKVKLLNHRFLRRTFPGISPARTVPWVRTVIWGKRRYLTSLKRVYPSESAQKIRQHRWYIERDAVIVSYVATAFLIVGKGIRLAATVLCCGTPRCPK
ncbi:MAG: hypothetical protein PHI63_03295 [Patescibacteria group bacterium]|nr:hypothetical protein [Patescibacteria group bacterium]